jgi:hypothetical protein
MAVLVNSLGSYTLLGTLPSSWRLRLGRVIGIIAIHNLLGYLIPMGYRQLIRGVGACRRTATGVIMATVAVLLIIGGCNMEPIPSAEVVAAGDIASCHTGATRLPPSWSRVSTGRFWPWAMRLTPEARR